MILRRGTIGYDTVTDFAEIKAKVLYVLCRTDRLFPPSIAPCGDEERGSTPAISRSTANSVTRQAGPSTPNGRLCCAQFLEPADAASSG